MLKKIIDRVNLIFFSDDDSQQDMVIASKLSRMKAKDAEEACDSILSVATLEEKKSFVLSMSKDKGLRPFIKHELGL